MNSVHKPAGAPETALMTPEAVAAEIGISVETLATWRSTGRVKLPFVRIGGRVVRYKPADVAALVQAGYQPGAKEAA